MLGILGLYKMFHANAVKQHDVDFKLVAFWCFLDSISHSERHSATLQTFSSICYWCQSSTSVLSGTSRWPPKSILPSFCRFTPERHHWCCCHWWNSQWQHNWLSQENCSYWSTSKQPISRVCHIIKFSCLHIHSSVRFVLRFAILTSMFLGFSRGCRICDTIHGFVVDFWCFVFLIKPQPTEHNGCPFMWCCFLTGRDRVEWIFPINANLFVLRISMLTKLE